MIVNPYRFTPIVALNTWDPANKGINLSLSNGDTTATGGASTNNCVKGIRTKSSGWPYIEFATDADGSNNNLGVGICTATTALGNGLETTKGGTYVLFSPGGFYYRDGSTGSFNAGSVYGPAAVRVGVSFNFGTNTTSLYLDGVEKRTVVLAAGTYFPFATCYSPKVVSIMAPLFSPAGTTPW